MGYFADRYTGRIVEERCDFRLRNIGIARQSYDLLELETCLSNVLLPLEGLKVKKHLAKRKAKEILGYFGLNHKERQVVNTLSGGEKQLISFARTLLSDPKILVLDEATSSIDAKTEALLQQGIAELLKGRTSFIIAHRLSTLSNADRLFVLDKGRLAETGTHKELMEKKGGYYRLVMAQRQTTKMRAAT